MLDHRQLADALHLEGGRSLSYFEVADRIEAGLPLATVDALARAIAPGDARFKHRLVPKATYDRRKAAGAPLTAAEGERVARLARVWAFAMDVLKDEGDARHFLDGPHLMLEDRSALDVTLQSEMGAERVMEILGGLKHGTAV